MDITALSPDPILDYEDHPLYRALVVYAPRGDYGRERAVIEAICPEPQGLGWRVMAAYGWELKSGASVRVAFVGDRTDCKRLSVGEWHFIRIMDELPQEYVDMLKQGCRSSVEGIEARFVPYDPAVKDRHKNQMKHIFLTHQRSRHEQPHAET